MAAVVLALAASGCWGLADFAAGLKTRARSPCPSSSCSWRASAGARAGRRRRHGRAAAGHPRGRGLAGGGRGGRHRPGLLLPGAGHGTMSVVAPISATGVALPVLVGVLTGDTLSVVVSAGLVLAVAGVLLASREPAAEAGGAGAGRPAGERRARARGRLRLRHVLRALRRGGRRVRALAPGPVARRRARPCSCSWPCARRARRPRTRGPCSLAGTLDVTATGLYGLANREGA